jgi:hypothetical protein
MATSQQFEDALAAVQKGPLPRAALDRLSAHQPRNTRLVGTSPAESLNAPRVATKHLEA